MGNLKSTISEELTFDLELFRETYGILWLLFEKSSDHLSQERLDLLLQVRVDRKDPSFRIHVVKFVHSLLICRF